MAVRLSSAFRSGLLDGKSIQQLTDDMVLNIYDGPIPESADYAPSGNLLVSLTRNGGTVTPGTRSIGRGMRCLLTNSGVDNLFQLILDGKDYGFTTSDSVIPSAAYLAEQINKYIPCNVRASTGGTATIYLQAISNNIPFYAFIYPYLNDDCSSLTYWTNGDSGSGLSTVTPKLIGCFDAIPSGDVGSAFSLSTGNTAGAGNYALISKHINHTSTNFVVYLDLYHSALGTIAHNDHFAMLCALSGVELAVRFATDGMTIYDGSAYNEIGVNIVKTGVSQKWEFWVTGGTPASATVNVYLDGVLQAAAVDCSYTGAYTTDLTLTQHGQTTINQTTYINHVVVAPTTSAYMELYCGTEHVPINTLRLPVLNTVSGGWTAMRGGGSYYSDSLTSLNNSVSDIWSGTALMSGQASYFRLVSSIDTNETDVLDRVFPRIQGDVGISAAAEMVRDSLTITETDTETVHAAQIFLISPTES
jgi:hypothetical protein